MSAEFERITLRNGDRAIRHLASGEVMHPSVGPWREANLLYVDQPRLRERLSAPLERPLRIWDVGLGAATNAVAALTAARELGARRARRLELVSFELTCEPLELALEDPAGFPFLGPWREPVRRLLADGCWEEGGVSWRLERGDLLSKIAASPAASLVFFDPFSPETNPALWTPEALSSLRAAVSDPEEGTVLITYSASTRTRVSLLLAGFFVGVGAPVGSRLETTLATTQPELLTAPLGARWLERWRRSDARAPHGHTQVPDLLAHPQFTRFSEEP